MEKAAQHTICFAGHHFYEEKQGGVELQIRYLGKALAQSGWKVAFIAPSRNGENGHEKINENIHLWRYPHFSYGYQAPGALIEKQLEAIRPTVIYQRGRGQLQESRVVLRYARQHAIPYAFALSSDADLERLSFTKTILSAPKPLWKKASLLPCSYWADHAMQQVLRQADYLIAQHEGQETEIKKKLRRQALLLRTMHPALERESRKFDHKLVLFVTNYRPWKQGELFVRLAERCKHLNCLFVIVLGRTKPEYVEPVFREAQGKANLTIWGELPTYKVENLMEDAALFVNTSLGLEGFPNTFVQCWLRETPTVSLHVNPGGVLTREKIGLHSGSFEQLVQDVTYLIEHDHERIEMGKRARLYAEQAHGFEYNVNKIADIFANMATKNRASSGSHHLKVMS